MSETFKIGDVFPVKSSEVLRAEGLQYWEQRISTPIGIFLYDYENEWRDGKDRWISEDGTVGITTDKSDNKIVLISQE